MKALFVVLILLLLAIALFFGLRVDNVAPVPSGPVPATAAQNASVPATATPAPAPAAGTPATGAVATTVRDVKEVADYATGYMPLKIKKSSEKKINDINAAHNADLQKAIDAN